MTKADNKQKKLMILGGSRYALPVIEAAHKLGLYVITCDYLPDNYAHRFSDEYCNVSIIDKEATLEAARRLEIDGIVSFACDPGVVTALPPLPCGARLHRSRGAAVQGRRGARPFALSLAGDRQADGFRGQQGRNKGGPAGRPSRCGRARAGLFPLRRVHRGGFHHAEGLFL